MNQSQRRRLAVSARETAKRVYWSEHDRDSHACQSCGVSDQSLDIHHTDGDWLNNHLHNLTAVCHRCHMAVHKMNNTVGRVQEMKADFEALTAL